MKVRGKSLWCCANHLDTKYNQYKVTLVVDKEEAAKLREVGLKVKKVVDENDDSISLQCTFTRNKLNKKTGVENPKPVVVDAATNIFTGNIGNGSDIIVRFKPYSWTFNGSTGVSGDLQGVQVITLVEYEGSNSTEDDDDDFEPIGEGLKGNEDNFKTEVPKKKKQQEEPEY